MALAKIDLGTHPNDRTGDDLYTAGGKINAAIEAVDAAIVNQVSGRKTYPTWTALSAVTGAAGDGAEVLASDTGSHTDPVVGGSVRNAGIYLWSASPAGWKWSSATPAAISTARALNIPSFAWARKELPRGTRRATLDRLGRVFSYVDAKGRVISNDPAVAAVDGRVTALSATMPVKIWARRELPRNTIRATADRSGRVISYVDLHGKVASHTSKDEQQDARLTAIETNPPALSALMPWPYIDGNEVRAVDGVDSLVADFGSAEVRSAHPFSNHSVRAVVELPSVSAVQTFTGRPGDGFMVPDSAKLLHVNVIYGQSLAVGSQGQPLISTTALYPALALMFSGDSTIDIRCGLPTQGESGESPPALDPATLTGFQPLVAKNGQGSGSRGQTIAETLANALSKIADDRDVTWRSLWFTTGFGGTVYAGLKKGTVPYSNMLAALGKAITLANAQGWTVVVDCMLWKHGEGNANDAAYASYLYELQTDFDADVKALQASMNVPVQQKPIHMFMTQPSSFAGSTTNTESVKAMLAVHRASEHHTLLSADYGNVKAYATDFIHLAAGGYHVAGEEIAPAIRDAWIGRKVGTPFIETATRSGTTVTLTYGGLARPPLRFVTDSRGERDVKGFRYRDGASFVTISSATITNDGSNGSPAIITLALGSTPAAGEGNEFIEYALNGQGGTRDAASIPRGNVYDSSGAVHVSTLDGRALNLPAAHQQIEVDVI